ncbi:MAG: hypothetical protein QOJ07_3335, partial [Thermoleophilaceae bacterium]|nr:hypothetical protein [Thermoleophilaceae bacterium]
MRKLAVVGLSLAAVALTPGLASAAPSWQSGTTDESSIENCYSVINGSPYLEVGAAATAYAYYDPAAPPPAGQTYYVAVTVFGLGNACAGQLADIEMALPPGTQPAITAQAPVRCRQMSIQNNAIVTSAPDTSGACPQNPTVGPHGGYSFDMAQNSGFGATPYYPLWP